jgi:hypothetical protein
LKRLLTMAAVLMVGTPAQAATWVTMFHHTHTLDGKTRSHQIDLDSMEEVGDWIRARIRLKPGPGDTPVSIVQTSLFHCTEQKSTYLTGGRVITRQPSGEWWEPWEVRAGGATLSPAMRPIAAETDSIQQRAFDFVC